MDPSLDQKCDKLSDFLHYIGRFTEANAATLLARLCRSEKLWRLEDLEKYVQLAEQHAEARKSST